MIRKAGDRPVEHREQMRGGKGTVIIEHLERELLPAGGRLFAKLTLAPGCSIGEHTHEGEAEMFYFAHGQGIVTDDGASIPVAAGDTMTTMPGHAHSVENTGDTNLVIIAAIMKD